MIYQDSKTLLEVRGLCATVNGVEILKGIDHVSVTLNLDGERIDGIAFQGESCAILPWHTLHAAFNSAASTSTQAEDDPMHAPIGKSGEVDRARHRSRRDLNAVVGQRRRNHRLPDSQ